jgi:hypothetical protein
LYERVQPGKHAHAAKLLHENRLRQVRRSQRVKHVDGKTEEERHAKQDRPDTGEPVRGKPWVSLVGGA